MQLKVAQFTIDDILEIVYIYISCSFFPLNSTKEHTYWNAQHQLLRYYRRILRRDHFDYPRLFCLQIVMYNFSADL